MLKDITTGLKKNKTLYSIVCFAIAAMVIVIVYKIYKGIRAASVTLGEAGKANATSVATGIPVNRVNLILQTAQELWEKAVTTYWLLGGSWTGAVHYDNQKFIDAINAMTSTKEVAMLDQSFREHSGYRIKEVIDKSFDKTFTTNEKAKINPAWLQVLYS